MSDEGDACTFFNAAYGSAVVTSKPMAWGQRRRLLEELHANLDGHCQVRSNHTPSLPVGVVCHVFNCHTRCHHHHQQLLARGAESQMRVSSWATATLRRELLASIPGGARRRLSSADTPHEPEAEEEVESENVITVSWALASSPAPHRHKEPQMQMPSPPPSSAASHKQPEPSSPAAVAPTPAPAAPDGISDLDLDFLAGSGGEGKGTGIGGSSGSAGENGKKDDAAAAVTALSQTMQALGLGDTPPLAPTNGTATAAVIFSPPSFPSPRTVLGVRRQASAAAAEAVIAEVPDLAFVLSKVPFLPHHHLPSQEQQQPPLPSLPAASSSSCALLAEGGEDGGQGQEQGQEQG